jgi:hypothetical protein
LIYNGFASRHGGELPEAPQESAETTQRPRARAERAGIAAELTRG